MNVSYFPLFSVLFVSLTLGAADLDPTDESNPHRDPSRCEVCKYVAQELQETMAESGKTKEVLHIGQQFDKDRKAIKYHKSELRLIEALEEVCQGILKLNIHAERSSSLRFSKGQSETMSTLHGLQAKGVKVDLGIPEDMWDKPSAPVTRMKQNCEQLIEEQEDAISNWFFKTDQETSLINYLCVERVLQKDQQECLSEVWTGKEKIGQDTDAPPDSGPLPTATPKSTPKPPKTKKIRGKKKPKAGKRGKGKKPRSGKTVSKNSKHNSKKRDEL